LLLLLLLATEESDHAAVEGLSGTSVGYGHHFVQGSHLLGADVLAGGQHIPCDTLIAGWVWYRALVAEVVTSERERQLVQIEALAERALSAIAGQLVPMEIGEERVVSVTRLLENDADDQRRGALVHQVQLHLHVAAAEGVLAGVVELKANQRVLHAILESVADITSEIDPKLSAIIDQGERLA